MKHRLDELAPGPRSTRGARPVASTKRVLKPMDELDRLIALKPAEAKEALACIIESIVPTPGPTAIEPS